MRIAIVYDAVYPYVIGGGEKRNWEFARRLVARGHEVTLVGMKFWEGPSEIVKEGVRIAGVCKAVPLYRKNGSRSVTEPFYFGWHVFFYLLRHDFDVVDCGNFPYVSAIAARKAMWLKRRATPLVITWHEVWGKKHWKDYSPLGIGGYLLERATSRLTRHNIAVSNYTRRRAEEILGLRPEQVSVIPNGIELSVLRERAQASKQRTIVCAGRLIAHKQVDLLIEAFSDGLAQGSFTDASLVIVGDGPEMERLRGLVRQRGREKEIVFAGFVDSEAVHAHIGKAAAFVLPSRREGFGMVIIEAMALGTPVIALDHEFSAAGDIVHHEKDGLLVKDRAGLCAAIASLLSNPERGEALAKGGQATAAAYDFDGCIVPQLEEYYRRITARG